MNTDQISHHSAYYFTVYDHVVRTFAARRQAEPETGDCSANRSSWMRDSSVLTGSEL